MRRIWTLTGAVLLALGVAVVPPVAASASGVASAVAGACNDSAYPPAPHAQIMASTTTPSVGETIEASGAAYCPDEDVRITLAGRFVTTTHTDGTGAFDPPVTVPRTGTLLLCGIGASGLRNDRDCLTLTVQAHNNNGGGGHHSGGGGTSFTGTDILLLVLLAAVLLAAGWALVAAGRRRRLADIRS
jgi:hypothetical protein